MNKLRCDKIKFGNWIQLRFIALCFIILNSCKKETVPVPSVSERYFPTVKTIVQHNCLSCHGSSGGFSGRPTAFDNDGEISTGYRKIKAVVADPVTLGPFGNKRMPPDTVLSASDVDAIVKWSDKGGKISD